MNKLLISMAVLGCVSIALAADAPTTAPVAQDPAKVIIRVGADTVTVADFNNLVDSLPDQVRVMAKGPGKRMLAEKLVEVKLLKADAIRQGLENDPKIKTQLELSREQVLAQAAAEKAQGGNDDAALKVVYEQQKGTFEQVKARHILIRAAGSPAPLGEGKKELTDDQAKAKATEIRDRLVNKKEDFATVAKAESDDRGSAAQGGSLGTFGRGQMVGPFDETAFAAKVGDVSQPVKTVFGYHLIQVEDHKTQGFDEVKDQLAAQQAPKKVDDLIKKLKETNKVVIDESFFGPAVTRPTMPPNGMSPNDMPNGMPPMQ